MTVRIGAAQRRPHQLGGSDRPRLDGERGRGHHTRRHHGIEPGCPDPHDASAHSRSGRGISEGQSSHLDPENGGPSHVLEAQVRPGETIPVGSHGVFRVATAGGRARRTDTERVVIGGVGQRWLGASARPGTHRTPRQTPRRKPEAVVEQSPNERPPVRPPHESGCRSRTQSHP